jgi:plasmid stability protein
LFTGAGDGGCGPCRRLGVGIHLDADAMGLQNDCKDGAKVAVLTLRDVPADVYAALKAEAKSSGRSLTAVAREALRAYAEEVDRRQRLQGALGRLDRLHARILERRSGKPTSDSTALLRADRDR